MDRKSRKILYGTIIIICIAVAVLSIVIDMIPRLPKTNSEIKRIAVSKTNSIIDNKLEIIYNKFKDCYSFNLVISKKSARNEDEAKDIAIEYKDNLKYIKDLEYIELTEEEQYYIFKGEYTTADSHKYEKYVLIFKTDYFEYPYYKKYTDETLIKEFGDILVCSNYSIESFIKSEIIRDKDKFEYKCYYVDKSYTSPKPVNGMSLAVITGCKYYLDEISFTIDKTTGETDISIEENPYVNNSNYVEVKMKITTLKEFEEDY